MLGIDKEQLRATLDSVQSTADMLRAEAPSGAMVRESLSDLHYAAAAVNVAAERVGRSAESIAATFTVLVGFTMGVVAYYAWKASRS